VSAPHELLQYKHSVHVRGDCHVLRREFLGRGGALCCHRHGHATALHGRHPANIFKGIDGSIGEFAERASTGGGERLRRSAGTTVGVGDGFALSFVGRVQRVAERLAFTDARLGKLLRLDEAMRLKRCPSPGRGKEMRSAARV